MFTVQGKVLIKGNFFDLNYKFTLPTTINLPRPKYYPFPSDESTDSVEPFHIEASVGSFPVEASSETELVNRISRQNWWWHSPNQTNPIYCPRYDKWRDAQIPTVFELTLTTVDRSPWLYANFPCVRVHGNPVACHEGPSKLYTHSKSCPTSLLSSHGYAWMCHEACTYSAASKEPRLWFCMHNPPVRWCIRPNWGI